MSDLDKCTAGQGTSPCYALLIRQYRDLDKCTTGQGIYPCYTLLIRQYRVEVLFVTQSKRYRVMLEMDLNLACLKQYRAISPHGAMHAGKISSAKSYHLPDIVKTRLQSGVD